MVRANEVGIHTNQLPIDDNEKGGKNHGDKWLMNIISFFCMEFFIIKTNQLVAHFQDVSRG